MSRRSQPFRNLSIPALIVLGIVVGFRMWQENSQPPQKPNKTTKTKRTPRPTASSSRPSERGSSEGNLLLGIPSGAGKTPENYLLEHPQYALSYNHDNGGANWVSWHTDASNLGDLERGKFAPDPDLPPDWQIRPNDYKGSGYDRGHLCPSADRNSSREDNNATFYMSNMLPQTAPLNQHVWADLENYLRDQVRSGNEIYQVAGGNGSNGKIAGGKINVPKVCWKVAIIIPTGIGDLARIKAKSRVIAVGIPNEDDKQLETADWRSYLTTVSKIEGDTRLDLLSALPDSIERQLEAKLDSVN